MFQEAKARNCNAITAALDFSKKDKEEKPIADTDPVDEDIEDEEEIEDEAFGQTYG